MSEPQVYPAALVQTPWTGPPPQARVRVPGSKSLTNRALIVAALADGASTLTGALDSEDTRVMVDSLGRLGDRGRARPGSATIGVTGCGGSIPAHQADLYVANSGTSLRFLTALVTLGRGTYTLDGMPRMRQRPVADLLHRAGRPGGGSAERPRDRVPAGDRPVPAGSTAAMRSSKATCPASSSAAC